MSNNIFDKIGVDISYVVIALCALILLLCILLIVILVKIKKIKSEYRQFMQGKDGKALEDCFKEKFHEMDKLISETNKIKSELTSMDEEMKKSISKYSVVKYDAFKEMGGALSFALALLDDKNNGFIINSMHSREGCYTYAKEILNGQSYVVLSDEEKEALNNAINVKNIL